MKKYFWLFSSLIYTSLIVYLSISKPLINYTEFKGEDKIIHFIAYFIGTDLTFMALQELKKIFTKFSILIIYSLLPIITEYIQSFSKYHVFDVKDMYAGFFGMAVGFIYYMAKRIAFEDVKP